MPSDVKWKKEKIYLPVVKDANGIAYVYRKGFASKELAMAWKPTEGAWNPIVYAVHELEIEVPEPK